MKPRKIYIAALARELAPLTRRLSRVTSPQSSGIYLWANDNCVLGYAGMGPARATIAFEAALALGPAESITSIGWAGACIAGINIGQVLHPSTIIDARTGERFFAAEGDGTVLATISRFATIAEKHRLQSTYGATCVEMEAATIARLAAAHKIPFTAIKSISDTLDFELPGIEGFHTAKGEFREAAFGFHVAIRPWLWRSVIKMARGSKLAVVNHCTAVAKQVELNQLKG